MHNYDIRLPKKKKKIIYFFRLNYVKHKDYNINYSSIER